MLDPDAIRRRRLARHFLSSQAVDIETVVAGIGTVHAQVQQAAELAISLRCKEVTAAQVRSALWEHGRLVRTYGLRGTIHLVPAAELDLWLTALRTLPRPAQRGDPVTLLGPAKIVELVAAITATLADHPAGLDLKSLGKLLEPRLGSWAVEPIVPSFGAQLPAWNVGIAEAAYQGELVLGRMSDGRTGYLPREVQRIVHDPDAAVAEVVRRYLKVYGPATEQDVARWFRTSRSAARLAVAAVDAVQVPLPDGHGWVLPGDEGPTADDEVPAGVQLLSHFDAFLVGSRPRSDLVANVHSARLLRNGASGPVPALLIDGQACGVWRHTAQRERELIEVEPFATLGKIRRGQLDEAARRVGRALGREVELRIGPVDARAHL